MRVKSSADRAAAKARPALKSVTRTVAGGVLLAAMFYPAIATTAAADKASTVAAKRLAIAASPLGSRLKYLGTPIKNPARKPAGANPDEKVTVVVRLSAAPVAAARALTADHRISADEKTSIRQKTDAEQAAVAPTIEARGGRILARYSSALNGVKVLIARREVDGLKSLPGVVDVLPVNKWHLTNAESVPFIGAPLVWQAHPGYKGENIKVAIIDTGIDYTHANFGGPGTPAAYTAAHDKSTKPADPKLFGPNAPKVKGGIDLVGDDYDANNASSVPVPDSNPLDCEGHGSHVAGTAAGFGIGEDGKTYHGPRNATAYTQQKFIIGPGVAPAADLYAVRVFGCTGSTNVVVDAIDWAIDNDMDVISMSLGADYGPADSADGLAVKAATTAGVVVVAASGNAGPAPYITSEPASGQGGISVAAIDSHKNFPGASVSLSTNKTITALDANGASLTGALDIVVLRTAAGDVSLGCDDSEYVDSKIKGKLVVTARGTCDRIARAQMGQMHGAAAVAMINNGDGYPPYEGPIPDVTIPFLGIQPSDATALTAANKATKFAANTIANPTYKTVASFSSGGPRIGDSALRPNISAPGVSIFSTSIGTGNGGEFESGTSMATPHMAGVAALAIQAHPKWNADAVRSAIVESADPAKLLDYTPRLEGAGLTQPVGATKTQAVVVNGGQQDGVPKGFFFGFEEFAQDFSSTREMTIANYGSTKVDFTLSTTAVGGSPHKATLSQTHITVDANSIVPFKLTLAVPAKTAGSTHDDAGFSAFQEVAGYVTLKPSDAASNNGVSLTVPYYLVPRTRSNVYAFLPNLPTAKEPTKPLLIGNFGGAIAGTADLYAWGLFGNTQDVTSFNARAVGAQTNLISADDSVVYFAVNTFKRFSTSLTGEFDILIDTDGDGKADYDLFAIDEGLLTAGTFSGLQVSVLANLKTGDLFEEFLVDSPTDGSTVLIPVLASDMGVTPTSPRISYTASIFNVNDGTSGSLPGKASFNVFNPAITTGFFGAVAPGQAGNIAVSIDAAEIKKTPPKGLMVVTTDNFAGNTQATLIPVK